MALAPYSQFETEADAAATAKYQRWLVPLAIVFAIIGAVGGDLASKLTGAVIGAVIGLAVGALIHQLIIHFSASSSAADAYTVAWCGENGCTFLGDDQSPPNGPHHDSGVRRKATDAIEGRFGDYDTLFYNFSYWTQSTDDEGNTTETEHPLRIMRLTGKTIPISSLSWSKRGFMHIRAFDKLQGAVTSERPIELESVEFNKLFDLAIDDKADDIWIRRIFDPATIQECVDGTIKIPNLRYFDAAWWLEADKHYKAKELDTLKPWQANAAITIDHLARVQDL